MAILLKTASVRVSSIQIMQVRVQNKGKSVWKIRYDRDVVGTEDKLVFNSCKAVSASGVRFMGPAFFKILKNGKARSTTLEMNLLRAAMHPVKCLTSLTILVA